MKENNKKNLYKDRGVTLIELIIVLSILTIFISAVISMGLFGNKVFNKGASKSEVQSNIRFAADYISKQLRYASNVSLTNDNDTSSKIATNEYIYIDSSGTLKHFANGTTKDIVKITDGDISEALKFDTTDGSNVVNFFISGSIKKESYSLNSTVYLLNQNTGVSISKTATPTAVSYTPGVAFTSDENTNDVTSLTISAPNYLVNPNSTVQLSVIVLPTFASQMVTWQVDPNYGYVDPTNNILHVLETAPKNSSFTVKAISVNNTSKYYTKVFTTSGTVAADVPVSSMTINTDQSFIFNNGGILILGAAVSPYNATYDKINWSVESDDPDNIYVESTGAATGKLTIKNATTANKLTVIAEVSGIKAEKTIDVATIKINDGKPISVSKKDETYNLSCKVYINGSNKLLTETYGIETSNIKWELKNAKKGASFSSQTGNTVTLNLPNANNESFTVVVTVKTQQGVYISADIGVTIN